MSWATERSDEEIREACTYLNIPFSDVPELKRCWMEEEAAVKAQFGPDAEVVTFGPWKESEVSA